ncbi:hypothetical protein MKX08_001705 [Trichoderma sp. CBMAI-0020]|nr:hypothetical protein MKX08_001705 [Trichoderma sp. CBMAI-0020]
MEDVKSQDAERSIIKKPRLQKSHELLTCTIKSPSFSYIHLELLTDPPDASVELDNLQVKSYCTAALTQFLGITGSAISLDILKIEESGCWIRVPRDDLGPFAAALTAWKVLRLARYDGRKRWTRPAVE